MNRLLALLPQEGVKETGRIISQGGNDLVNLINQNKVNARQNRLLELSENNQAHNQDRQNRLLAMQEDAHAQSQSAAKSRLEMEQERWKSMSETDRRAKALENMQLLDKAADTLLSVPEVSRPAQLRAMYPQLRPFMDVSRLADQPLDDGSLQTFKKSLVGVRQKLGKGFTLSEGQTRFDAQGNPVASVAEVPEKGKGFDQEGKLRGEFTKFSKDFQTQNASFGRIQASANDPTAAGDLALIFNFMKLLDPGSTVREGEFDTAQGAFGALNKAEEEGNYVPNFIKRGVQQLMEGTRLLPEQREDFYGRAQALFGDAQEQHGRRAQQYTNLANAYDLDPSRVVIDLQTVDPDKQVNLGQAAPQNNKYSMGQIIEHGGKKYRVTGGDLNDPEVELVQ